MSTIAIDPGPSVIHSARRHVIRAVIVGVKKLAAASPLTARGALATVALAAGLRFWGFSEQDQVLFSLGFSGLVLILGLTVFVQLAAILGRRRLVVEARALVVDAAAGQPGNCRMPRPFWAPLVSITTRFPGLPELSGELVREGGFLVERLRVPHRLSRATPRRALVVEDILGLTRARRRIPGPREIEARPVRGPLESARLLPEDTSDSMEEHPEGKPLGDLLDMRRHQPGDSPRFVLWKVLARTGRLMVRTAERTRATDSRLLVYLAAGEGDEASAGVARSVLEELCPTGSALFLADGASRVATELDASLTQVARSLDHREAGGAGLATLFAEGRQRGVSRGLLFVPAVPGPWLDIVEAHLAATTGAFRVLIGVDVIPVTSAARSPGWIWRRSARQPDPQSFTPIVTRLSRHAPVSLVERPTGVVREPPSISFQKRSDTN